MIKILDSIYLNLLKHAFDETPIEACGYLAEKEGIIETIYPLRNVDQSSEHFSLDPKEQFETVRKIRNDGSKIAAVYHSHPSTPARPSQEDIRLAYDSSISYVIVSLANNHPDVKAFRIHDGIVEEEVIEIIKQKQLH